MRRAIHVDGSEQAVRDLLEMLHKGATADDFAARLAELDALPASYPGKSALVETVRMAMAVRNRLELQEQRERGLLAVIASAQDLSSRLDLRELLVAIVSRARNLLGSDVAWLSTYDADAGEIFRRSKSLPTLTVRVVLVEEKRTPDRRPAIPVTTTISVPEQRTENVATTQYRQVSENVTQRYPVSVPFQVPVTLMTYRPRQVTETVTQQYPVSVPIQVPVTVMKSQARQVTDIVTHQVPETKTTQVPITVYKTQSRQVTENVTRNYTVCVPIQVPCTVMTTQTRQVPRQVAVCRQVMVPVSTPAAVSPAPSPQAFPKG